MTRARHFRLLAEQYAREAKHIATPTLKARHDELTRALSALAERYGIRSIPTLLYFTGGEVRKQTVGVVSKKTIVSTLEAVSVAA